MAATLRIASERRAYALTDRATFLQLAPGLALQPLFEHDPDLLNTYGVVVLGDADRARDAIRFVTWLSEGDGRARISSFTVAGTRPLLGWGPGPPAVAPGGRPRGWGGG